MEHSEPGLKAVSRPASAFSSVEVERALGEALERAAELEQLLADSAPVILMAEAKAALAMRELEAARSRDAAAESQFAEMASTLATTSQLVQDHEAAKRVLEERLLSYTLALDEARARASQLEEALARSDGNLDIQTSLEATLTELRRELQDANERTDRMNGDIEHRDNIIREMSARIEMLALERARDREALAEMRLELQEVNDRARQTDGNVEDLQGRLKKADARAELQTLQSVQYRQFATKANADLEEAHALIDKLRKTIDNNLDVQKSLEQALAETRLRLDEADERTEKANVIGDDLRTALKDSNAKAQLLIRDGDRDREALEIARAGLAEANMRIENLSEQLEQRIDRESELEEAWAVLFSELEEARSLCAVATMELDYRNARITGLQSAGNDARTLIDRMNNDNAALKAEIERLEQARTELFSMRERYASLSAEVSLLRVSSIKVQARADDLQEKLTVVSTDSSAKMIELKVLHASALSALTEELEAVRAAALSQAMVHEQYVGDLKATWAALLKRSAETEGELQRVCVESEDRDRMARKHIETLERRLKEIEVLEHRLTDAKTREAELSMRIEGLENTIAATLQSECALTRAEASRVETLVDVVQSSHFWRLKHWLRRLAGRS